MVFNYFTISSLINALTSFILCALVFFRNSGLRLNRSFSLFAFSVGFWATNHFFAFAIQNGTAALFFHRALMAGAIFIPTTFFHFVCIFLDIDDKKRKLIVSGYIASFIFLLSDFTPLFIPSVSKKLIFDYFENFGPMYHPFLVMFAGFTFYSHYLMFKGFSLAGGARANQIKYIFTGTFIGFIGGSTSFFLVYNIPIAPVGNCLVAVYVLMVAIAILKYRLMDINVVLTRAGIFTIVYLFVLGIPFILGYKYNLWHLATWVTVFLATAGPSILISLIRQAEKRLLAEERQAHRVLTQATVGMMRYRNLKKLISLIEHVTCKTLRLENACVFLLDEKSSEYKLEAVRLKSKYHYREVIKNDDALVQRLSTFEEPLVYEDVKQRVQELKDNLADPIHKIASQMRELSAAVILPAISHSRLLGFLCLGEKKSKRMYTKDDLDTLWALSYQAALAIQNALFWEKEETKLIDDSREEVVSAVTFGAGHQFNNRLYAISLTTDGLLEVIKDRDQLNTDGLRALVNKISLKLNKISEECQFGGQITAGIMGLTGNTPQNFKAFDPVPIIISSIEFVEMKHSRDRIEDKRPQVAIINHISQNLPFIFGSDAQIRDCLFNIIDNAYDAVYEKEDHIKGVNHHGSPFVWPQGEPYLLTIEINALAKDGQLFITITDNGMGIKEDDAKKLFAGFFTTKATSVKGYCKGGHGIGMFTVKKLITAHKGKIYFASEYGKGTTFTIELPLAKEEDKEKKSDA